ncbi:MAG: hypothetical protein U5K56_08850 [Halioglobus sp.]|nr:hypothetical protein [Halioglobus sp.]
MLPATPPGIPVPGVPPVDDPLPDVPLSPGAPPPGAPLPGDVPALPPPSVPAPLDELVEAGGDWLFVGLLALGQPASNRHRTTSPTAGNRRAVLSLL